MLSQKLKISLTCTILPSLTRKRETCFYTIEELVSQAEQFSGSVSELMIATEIELTGRNRDEILTIMSRNLTVMKKFYY